MTTGIIRGPASGLTEASLASLCQQPLSATADAGTKAGVFGGAKTRGSYRGSSTTFVGASFGRAHEAGLTNPDLCGRDKLISRYWQVGAGRSTANAPREIEARRVARAEPALRCGQCCAPR